MSIHPKYDPGEVDNNVWLRAGWSLDGQSDFFSVVGTCCLKDRLGVRDRAASHKTRGMIQVEEVNLILHVDLLFDFPLKHH